MENTPDSQSVDTTENAIPNAQSVEPEQKQQHVEHEPKTKVSFDIETENKEEHKPEQDITIEKVEGLEQHIDVSEITITKDDPNNNNNPVTATEPTAKTKPLFRRPTIVSTSVEHLDITESYDAVYGFLLSSGLCEKISLLRVLMDRGPIKQYVGLWPFMQSHVPAQLDLGEYLNFMLTQPAHPVLIQQIIDIIDNHNFVNLKSSNSYILLTHLYSLYKAAVDVGCLCDGSKVGITIAVEDTPDTKSLGVRNTIKWIDVIHRVCTAITKSIALTSTTKQTSEQMVEMKGAVWYNLSDAKEKVKK